MTEVSTRNFGLLIAYVIPGFLIIVAAGTYSETIRTWLSPTATGAPTVGGFLYVTIASVAAGMVVSAIRWLLLDRLHHLTGVPRQQWDVSSLSTKQATFEAFIEYHYRHYLFYGNSLLSLILTIPIWLTLPFFVAHRPMVIIGTSALAVVLFLASRDTFRKYNSRTNVLLKTTSR